jgi:RES domain-containing protein
VAVQESRATATYAGIPLPFRTPRLLVAIELSLHYVLDLTDSDVLRRLELSVDELPVEDWRKVQAEGFESLTQTLGRAAFEIGASGLLVPSARVPDGVNVVYFPENRAAGEEAKVCESEKLDRIRGATDE